MAASVAYVGSQGRNLFLRSIANQIVGVQTNGASAATSVREFDIVTCANGTSGTGILCPGSTHLQRPESVRRNRLQDQRRPRQLQRDAAGADPPLGQRPGAERAVHARLQQGQHRRLERSRPRPATTRRERHRRDFDYDNGYNNFDVRHTFNFSALYTIAWQRRADGRLVARRHRQRAQRPADATC